MIIIIWPCLLLNFGWHNKALIFNLRMFVKLKQELVMLLLIKFIYIYIYELKFTNYIIFIVYHILSCNYIYKHSNNKIKTFIKIYFVLSRYSIELFVSMWPLRIWNTVAKKLSLLYISRSIRMCSLLGI